MPTDTSFGETRLFEDFLGSTISKFPYISIIAASGGTTECVDDAADGRISIVVAGADGAEHGAVSSANTNFTAGDGNLKMEVRINCSDITDYTLFVGFCDEVAGGDEMPFTITGDVEASGAGADSLGFYYDSDATTDVWRCMAQNTSTITSNYELASGYNFVAATFITLGVYLSLDRKSAVWYINGEEIYRIDAATTALVGAVGLSPGVFVYDENTGTTFEIDYLYASKGRSTT